MTLITGLTPKSYADFIRAFDEAYPEFDPDMLLQQVLYNLHKRGERPLNFNAMINEAMRLCDPMINLKRKLESIMSAAQDGKELIICAIAIGTVLGNTRLPAEQKFRRRLNSEQNHWLDELDKNYAPEEDV